MKEWLFLDGIALHSAHITPGNVKFPALVVTHFAHAGLPFEDGTTMAARKTANAIAVNRFVEFAFTNLLVQDFPKRRHW